MCLSETLERACAQREQEQTRLLGGLASLAGAREARLDVSEQQLELAEEEEEPGPRALVTQLVGAAQEIRESGTRLVVRVDPGPVLSERAERLVQNANACRRCLEGERLLCRRGRRCPSEQRLCTQSRQLHIGRERQIAHLGGERQRDVGVPHCVVEPLEPPEAAGRDSFVGESKCLTIGTCQVDDLLEELPRLVGRFVEADACEDDERPRQFRAGLERCDHLAKLGLGSARVTGLEVEKRRLDRPSEPPRVVDRAGSAAGRGRGGGPQAAGLHVCAHSSAASSSAAATDSSGSSTEAASCHARASGSSRSSASRAWISLRRTKSATLYAPAASKRVSEADPVAVDLDDAGLDRRNETRLAIDPGGRLDDRRRRMSMRRRSEQEVTALGRERLESCLNELVERLGHRQQLPRLDDRVAAFQRAGDLEREERIAPRRLVDLRQKRARHGEVEVLADDRVQRPEVERSDLDRVNPLRRQAAPDVGSDRAFRRPAT